jgi:hypothetical protein
MAIWGCKPETTPAITGQWKLNSLNFEGLTVYSEIDGAKDTTLIQGNSSTESAILHIIDGLYQWTGDYFLEYEEINAATGQFDRSAVTIPMYEAGTWTRSDNNFNTIDDLELTFRDFTIESLTSKELIMVYHDKSSQEFEGWEVSNNILYKYHFTR